MTVLKGHLVVKLGGAAVDDPEAAAAVLADMKPCLAAGWRLTVIHGGGKRLTALAGKLGLTTKFVAGRRVTDAETLETAKLVLAGGVATDLAAMGQRLQLPLVPISGVAAGTLAAHRRPPRQVTEGSDTRVVDFGLVGDINQVKIGLIAQLHAGGFVPLISSLAVDEGGQVLNVNADTVAAKVAAALAATGAEVRVLLLTDVDGVRRSPTDATSRISVLDANDLAALAGTSASGGMLPKLESMAACLAGGARSVHVASWQTPHVLTASLAGGDFGTRLVGEGSVSSPGS